MRIIHFACFGALLATGACGAQPADALGKTFVSGSARAADGTFEIQMLAAERTGSSSAELHYYPLKDGKRTEESFVGTYTLGRVVPDKTFACRDDGCVENSAAAIRLEDGIDLAREHGLIL